MMGFFEDLTIGETEELGSHSFTAEEIKAFAAAYDPQAFHLDEEAGRQSHFGGLCASGWHTAAVWMGLMIAHAKRFAAEAEAAGRPVPELGPSPAFVICAGSARSMRATRSPTARRWSTSAHPRAGRAGASSATAMSA